MIKLEQDRKSDNKKLSYPVTTASLVIPGNVNNKEEEEAEEKKEFGEFNRLQKDQLHKHHRHQSHTDSVSSLLIKHLNDCLSQHHNQCYYNNGLQQTNIREPEQVILATADTRKGTYSN